MIVRLDLLEDLHKQLRSVVKQATQGLSAAPSQTARHVLQECLNRLVPPPPRSSRLAAAQQQQVTPAQQPSDLCAVRTLQRLQEWLQQGDSDNSKDGEVPLPEQQSQPASDSSLTAMLHLLEDLLLAVQLKYVEQVKQLQHAVQGIKAAGLEDASAFTGPMSSFNSSQLSEHVARVEQTSARFIELSGMRQQPCEVNLSDWEYDWEHPRHLSAGPNSPRERVVRFSREAYTWAHCGRDGRCCYLFLPLFVCVCFLPRGQVLYQGWRVLAEQYCLCLHAIVCTGVRITDLLHMRQGDMLVPIRSELFPEGYIPMFVAALSGFIRALAEDPDTGYFCRMYEGKNHRKYMLHPVVYDFKHPVDAGRCMANLHARAYICLLYLDPAGGDEVLYDPFFTAAMMMVQAESAGAAVVSAETAYQQACKLGQAGFGADAAVLAAQQAAAAARHVAMSDVRYSGDSRVKAGERQKMDAARAGVSVAALAAADECVECAQQVIQAKTEHAGAVPPACAKLLKAVKKASGACEQMKDLLQPGEWYARLYLTTACVICFIKFVHAQSQHDITSQQYIAANARRSHGLAAQAPQPLSVE